MTAEELADLAGEEKRLLAVSVTAKLAYEMANSRWFKAHLALEDEQHKTKLRAEIEAEMTEIEAEMKGEKK